MPKEYIIEPKSVISKPGGKLFRPFYINGKEIYQLDINKTSSSNDESKEEIEVLRKKVSDFIGKELTNEQLIQFINNRKITIEE